MFFLWPNGDQRRKVNQHERPTEERQPPKRRRVATVEVAELIKENDRRFSEVWAEMEEKQRRAEEARLSEAREAAEREESHHRKMVAIEETRFDFLREIEERRERGRRQREGDGSQRGAAREGDSRQRGAAREGDGRQRGAPPHPFGKDFSSEIIIKPDVSWRCWCWFWCWLVLCCPPDICIWLQQVTVGEADVVEHSAADDDLWHKPHIHLQGL
ncbi:hypothetical protein EYF80_041836 [Liparis tanakae]|uniref:Uncharacterized protein n=1 Tax=Liparis tanakae TaxID=230148 RepID=A0A4Z2G5B2_9TELE|nr:hypothetical protein EYF80_041836 [Liparis tanakae]